MGVTMFTLILIVAFRFVTSDLYIPGKETNAVLTEAKRLSESLMTPGIPANWSEDLVLIPGIVDEGNILNTTKLGQLVNLTNKSSNKVKQLFGIKSDFLVYFEDLDNNILWSFDNFYMGEESLTDELLAYYTLNNNYLDSHNSYDGVVSGSLSFDSNGKIGQAIINPNDGTDYFYNDDIDGYVSGSFTTCFWWNQTTSSTNNLAIISTRSFAGCQDCYDVFKLQSDEAGYENELRFDFYNNAARTTAYSGTSISDSEYHFVCIGFSDEGDDQFIFLDGNIVANISQTASGHDITTRFAFGASEGAPANNELGGNLDEVGVWNRALNKGEMDRLYNVGNALQYPFSGGLGATIGDVESINPEKIITLTRYLVYKHSGISEIIAMKVVLWQE